MKKVIIVVIIISLASIIIFNTTKNGYITKNYSFEGDSIDNYSEFINAYKKYNEEKLFFGEIKDKEKAVDIAEELFVSRKIKSTTLKEFQPFVAIYDENNEAWIVSGSCKISTDQEIVSFVNVPMLLIMETGEVIAYW